MSAVDGMRQVLGMSYPGHHAPKASHQSGKGLARDFAKSIAETIGAIGFVSGSPQGAAAAGAAGITGAGSSQEDLLQLQMQLQRQAQEFTLRTNIAQAEHDSRMTVIRGIRV